MSKFFTVENVPASVIERFFSKVMVSPVTDCWIWTGTIGGGSGGYSNFSYKGKTVYGHRFTYAWLRQPLLKGKGALQLDHVVCNNKFCVNPWHVELVSPKQNLLRYNNGNCSVNAKRSVCIRGHEFSVDKKGRRYCPICKSAYRRKYYLTNNR